MSTDRWIHRKRHCKVLLANTVLRASWGVSHGAQLLDDGSRYLYRWGYALSVWAFAEPTAKESDPCP